jgi:hypothetical protein
VKTAARNLLLLVIIIIVAIIQHHFLGESVDADSYTPQLDNGRFENVSIRLRFCLL